MGAVSVTSGQFFTSVTGSEMVFVYSGGSADAGPIIEPFVFSSVVSSGVKVSGQTISSGEAQTILAGGSSILGTVLSGGEQTILSGGVAKSETIDMQGTVIVSSGGMLKDSKLDLGKDATWAGQIILSSGAQASGVAVDQVGTIVVSSGAEITNLTMAGNYSWGPYLEVFGGGEATDVSIGSGAKFDLFGVADQVTIGNSAQVVISSGGFASGITVNNGGILYVSSGGDAEGVVVKPGGIVVDDGGTVNGVILLTAVVSSGVAASGQTVTVDESQTILAGGVVTNETVDMDGVVSVSSGGLLEDSKLVLGKSESWAATVTLYSGAEALDIDIERVGGMFVSNGAEITDLKMAGSYSWGPYLEVYSGGEASEVTMAAGARLDLFGTLDGATLTGGSGGEPEITVWSTGIADHVTINTSAEVVISSGGIASGITVNSGGTLYVYSGGTAEAVKVNTGGTVVDDGGTIDYNALRNNGIASGTVVTSVQVTSGDMRFLAAVAGVPQAAGSGGTPPVDISNYAGQPASFASGAFSVSAGTHGAVTLPAVEAVVFGGYLVQEAHAVAVPHMVQ